MMPAPLFKAMPGLMFGFSCLLAFPVFAAKTDVVELLNGDHITGEVDKLELGVLTFKTDHIGTLSIEWDHVARLKSDQLLEVELVSGLRLFGHVAPGEKSGEFIVSETEGDTHIVTVFDAVRMAPLEETGSIVDNIDAYIDLGFSDTKATEVREFTLDLGLTYRDRVKLWDFSYDTIRSETATATSDRSTLTGEFRRFFGNRWFWSGLMQFQQNDALDLDLRSLFGGSMGRYFVQTNHHELAASAGLAFSREDYVGLEKTDSTELMLTFGYHAFAFRDPDLDFRTQLVVFPSLTVSGRIRTQAEMRLRYEILDDLFAEVTLREYYDNKPQSMNAETRDYTITTSIGYSF